MSVYSSTTLRSSPSPDSDVLDSDIRSLQFDRPTFGDTPLAQLSTRPSPLPPPAFIVARASSTLARQDRTNAPSPRTFSENAKARFTPNAFGSPRCSCELSRSTRHPFVHHHHVRDYFTTLFQSPLRLFLHGHQRLRHDASLNFVNPHDFPFPTSTHLKMDRPPAFGLPRRSFRTPRSRTTPPSGDPSSPAVALSRSSTDVGQLVAVLDDRLVAACFFVFLAHDVDRRSLVHCDFWCSADQHRAVIRPCGQGVPLHLAFASAHPCRCVFLLPHDILVLWRKNSHLLPLPPQQ